MHPDEEKIEEIIPDNIPGLIEGRIVHYVLEAGSCQGEHRPAIIVKVWNPAYDYGLVNLQVFADGTNDGFREGHLAPADDTQVALFQHILWRTSVHYSENKEPGTWHWIEKA